MATPCGFVGGQSLPRCDRRRRRDGWLHDPDNLVEIRDLHFAYGKRKVLKGIDLDIPRGKVVAILGTSGSGKTTLLQLIGGLAHARARHA